MALDRQKRDRLPRGPSAASPPAPGIATNTVLIGMPAVGKSTVGVLLAKATGHDFLDTDVLLQARLQRSLQEMIDAEGLEAFCRIEERAVLELSITRCVIATGGSVVYSPAAMAHLGAGGVIVHLDEELDVLRRRLLDLQMRGVVMGRNQDLAELHRSRLRLYRQYAQLTIRCAGRTQDQITAQIVSGLGL